VGVVVENLRAKPLVVFGLLTLVAGSISGCAHNYATPEEAAKDACSAFGPKAMSGALIGGALGAGTGAAVGGSSGNGKEAAAGALVGLLVGVIAGAVAGNIADKGDCEQAKLALQQMEATPTGTAITWNNPASGSHGTYTPVSDTKTINGHVCREIRADYYLKNHQPVDGEPDLVCRTDSGDWARVTRPTT